MPILTAADKAAMRADILSVIDERPETITLRRGETSLPAQKVRLERRGGSSAQIQAGQGSEAGRGQIIILGTVDLNIQKDDRFTDAAGNSFLVVLVRTNREICTQAEAEVRQ